ncbi:MAG: hypothetical protein HRT69_11745 [Flavobacteriaceae bacterium]|nr:hypothetical protein [Flavobacteriaceae bacterium]
MKEIKEFIKEFIQKEYLFNHAEYDMMVEDDECDEKANIVNNYFHEYNSPNYNRVTSIIERRGNEKWENRYAKKMNKIIPRTLFQIKQYHSFELGDALQRIVTGKDLYACYVSYPSKGGRALYFSSIFYVSETNEGMKIIYEKSFDSDAGKWYHPVDVDVVTVISEGNLVAVEKYQTPEEETSLADYNK